MTYGGPATLVRDSRRGDSGEGGRLESGRRTHGPSVEASSRDVGGLHGSAPPLAGFMLLDRSPGWNGRRVGTKWGGGVKIFASSEGRTGRGWGVERQSKRGRVAAHGSRGATRPG